MRFFIIPVDWITRHLRRGAAKIMGEDEVQSLENDFTSFINEVYDDTVGDLTKGATSRNSGSCQKRK